MNASESFRALRRANPRAGDGFAQSVEAAARAVRVQIARPPAERPRRRRGLVLVSGAGAALAAAAAALVAVGSLGHGPSVETATAAVRKAATVTAESAERSGTVVVRLVRDGEPWAGKTVRWNGADTSIVDDVGPYRSSGGELRVVDGTLYGHDPGGWVDLGSVESIDPDSTTTPTEQLAAVREDVGGVTLRRVTAAMSGLTTSRLADGSTVYRGTVAAGLIAREAGFKEGRAIRVLPFGYVAHDEAADPDAPLAAAVTVGADGVVRALAVSWGTWTYTVAYTELGTTAAPVAPPNARSLLRERSPAG